MEPTQPQPSNPNLQSKKRLWLWMIIIAIAAVLVAAVTWASIIFYNQNKTADLQTQDGPTVVIGTNGFSPSVIKVKSNQQITWVTQDTKGHQLNADTTALPDFTTPEPLATGDSYSYTFETAGTYTYYDPANPQQFKGTVIVE